MDITSIKNHRTIILLSFMNSLKRLFLKGKYHLYLSYALLLEIQKHYLFPQTNLFKRIRQKAINQLKFTHPEQQHKEVKLQLLTEVEKNSLKSSTKKKVNQIQQVLSRQNSTWEITWAMMAMGAVNYFWSPTSCAIFVSFYLTMNTIDFLQSLVIIKWDVQPLWSVKMKDVGYVMAFGFGVVTIGMGLKRGLAYMKQRATKAIILRSQGKNE